MTKPVQPARKVPIRVTALLYARAAGMCEMPGCFDDLTSHHLTHVTGNFGQQSHIYAFSKNGARGAVRGRPHDPHTVENLILLCAKCHKQVDDAPADFPVEALRAFKDAHEARVQHVTRLDDSHRTAVLQLKSRIGNDPVEIPIGDLARALAPRYPKDRKGYVIDISSFDDRGPGFMEAAAEKISLDVARFYAPGMDADVVRHVSVFALAPMPLLVQLGAQLSNKIETDFFQRHRDGGGWAWKSDGPDIKYVSRLLKEGSDPTKTALVLSLSGAIDTSRVPAMRDATFAVREITLDGCAAGLGFLRRRQDLDAFADHYRACLAQIVSTQPAATELHLFPAVPAPVAIRCGFDVLKKVQPDLIVWDDDKAAGGWVRKLEVRYTS